MTAQALGTGEMPDLSELDEISTTKELAAYLKISPHVLDHLSSRGGGPRFSKVGKGRRYHREDVREYLARQRRGG